MSLELYNTCKCITNFWIFFPFGHLRNYLNSRNFGEILNPAHHLVTEIDEQVKLSEPKENNRGTTFMASNILQLTH